MMTVEMSPAAAAAAVCRLGGADGASSTVAQLGTQDAAWIRTIWSFVPAADDDTKSAIADRYFV